MVSKARVHYIHKIGSKTQQKKNTKGTQWGSKFKTNIQLGIN